VCRQIAIKKIQDDQGFDVTQAEIVGTVFPSLATVRVIQASNAPGMRDSVPPNSALRYNPELNTNGKRQREGSAQPNGVPPSSWKPNKRQRVPDPDQPLPSLERELDVIPEDQASRSGSAIPDSQQSTQNGLLHHVRTEIANSISPSPPPAALNNEDGLANKKGEKSNMPSTVEQSPILPPNRFPPTASASDNTRRATDGGTSVSTAAITPSSGVQQTPGNRASARRHNVLDPASKVTVNGKAPSGSPNEDTIYENIESDSESPAAILNKTKASLRKSKNSPRSGLPGLEWSNQFNTPPSGKRRNSRSQEQAASASPSASELPLTPGSKQREEKRLQKQQEDEARKAQRAAAAAAEQRRREASEQRKREAEEARQGEEARIAEEARLKREEEERKEQEKRAAVMAKAAQLENERLKKIEADKKAEEERQAEEKRREQARIEKEREEKEQAERLKQEEQTRVQKEKQEAERVEKEKAKADAEAERLREEEKQKGAMESATAEPKKGKGKKKTAAAERRPSSASVESAKSETPIRPGSSSKPQSSTPFIPNGRKSALKSSQALRSSSPMHQSSPPDDPRLSQVANGTTRRVSFNINESPTESKTVTPSRKSGKLQEVPLEKRSQTPILPPNMNRLKNSTPLRQSILPPNQGAAAKTPTTTPSPKVVAKGPSPKPTPPSKKSEAPSSRSSKGMWTVLLATPPHIIRQLFKKFWRYPLLLSIFEPL
jgi:hypothetical protein